MRSIVPVIIGSTFLIPTVLNGLGCRQAPIAVHAMEAIPSTARIPLAPGEAVHLRLPAPYAKGLFALRRNQENTLEMEFLGRTISSEATTCPILFPLGRSPDHVELKGDLSDRRRFESTFGQTAKVAICASGDKRNAFTVAIAHSPMDMFEHTDDLTILSLCGHEAIQAAKSREPTTRIVGIRSLGMVPTNHPCGVSDSIAGPLLRVRPGETAKVATAIERTLKERQSRTQAE